MRELLVYVLPAVLTYPIGIMIGKRLHTKATYWTLSIGTLVLMVVAVGVAALGGDQTFIAVPVGMAFGIVLGLRHGFSVIPALFGEGSAKPSLSDETEAPADTPVD